MALTEQWAAHNYHPLPVVVSRGEGAWVTDVEGRRYLDCLAGYSALNFGHCHPRLVARAERQLRQLTLTSRAFYNDQLGPFAEALGTLVGKEMILPMNSGAEAVETAIKVARRWGHQVKGVPADRARIIVMDGNFHGRTTTIVGFSTDEVARAGYGPFTPGFDVVSYGKASAVEDAITDDTVAVLLEPVQGEGGVLLPPDGFLRDVRHLCDTHGLLFVADEIQSGLARTGRTLALDHEGVTADIIVLGKALGGGILPVSAVAADVGVLGVITPGSHGSTFGGNPLAAAVGHEVCQMLATGEFQERATRLGARLDAGLRGLGHDGVREVRCRGLWAGVDLDPQLLTGRELCERLLERGVLAKDAHGSTVRLAPPLVATEDDIDLLVEAFSSALAAGGRPPPPGPSPAPIG
ncbi:MAG TPA: ornithine--oxo-acid transaminase [Intrasporangium sp.]|uniref:ornithine--oxo-acid transaminase n=1 Tax=Intrasporangium sp. TaxID=1925024 RepID=UPI002D7A3972|nr:ornithine--oxo-acid transaminase [Intrasporangium sp.]HET7398267.1 ornithine--oxo-acid transaminase [Intrasporangium sp.]